MEAMKVVIDRSFSRRANATELDLTNLPDFALLSVRCCIVVLTTQSTSMFIHLFSSIIVYSQIMTFFVAPSGVDTDSFLLAQSLCKKMHMLANSTALWDKVPLQTIDGALNKGAFRLIKQKYQGTEGTCYQTYCRPLRQNYALKKARSYKENEGIPYFLVRELAVLKNMRHPNVSEVSYVNVNDYSLHVLSPYVELTLEALLGSERFRIPIQYVKPLLYQLVAGVSYCHDRGVLHRNLKPKHILFVPGGRGERMIEGAKLVISDFALVRASSPPHRALTMDVVTMWYRAPELFLGEQRYGRAVDMWSTGCIFAEMVNFYSLFLPNLFTYVL